jgi:hypothetical protein
MTDDIMMRMSATWLGHLPEVHHAMTHAATLKCTCAATDVLSLLLLHLVLLLPQLPLLPLLLLGQLRSCCCCSRICCCHCRRTAVAAAVDVSILLL